MHGMKNIKKAVPEKISYVVNSYLKQQLMPIITLKTDKKIIFILG